MKGLLVALLLAACTGPSRAPGDAAPELRGTLVHTATVEVHTLRSEVVAPGQTDALRQVRVRAPFAGVLLRLRAVPGDVVRAGHSLGTLRSWESVAALKGAEALKAAATDDASRARAARALALAQQADVTWAVDAPESGVVLSVATGEGERVAEGDEILSIAPANALIFRARVAQGDLDRVARGQPVSIVVPGRAAPLTGVVHGALPQAEAGALTVPWRIDLKERLDPPVLGLFGEAHIVVGEHPGALVVPPAAVLTNDVTGTTRVATLDAKHHVHWVDVKAGLRDGDLQQVTGDGLKAGQQVVVSGQVGLPEGSLVRVAK